MSEEKVDVAQLQDYWEWYATLQDGQTIDRFVRTSTMPSWSDICDGLRWRSYGLGLLRVRKYGFCGVYRLVALSDDRSWSPARIPRLGGDDESGTLYIGEAEWLHGRLSQFRRSCKREESHGAGRMWRDCDLLRTRFPLNRLGVSVLATSLRMHEKIEGDLIRAYLNTFGDTPPLNCSY